jgi:hypothetical protein
MATATKRPLPRPTPKPHPSPATNFSQNWRDSPTAPVSAGAVVFRRTTGCFSLRSMRLSILESIVRATLLLAPAVIALVCASYVWAPSKYPELPAWRVKGFRWGMVLAWLATGFFMIASVDQLETRQVLPGFWSFLNLSAALLGLFALAGALSGRGWGRALLLGWGSLLVVGMLAVVASTIP